MKSSPARCLDAEISSGYQAPAQTPVMVPILIIAPNPGGVRLSWPTASVGWWILQTSPELAPANWQSPFGPMQIEGGEYFRVVPTTAPRAFFRLAQ